MTESTTEILEVIHYTTTLLVLDSFIHPQLFSIIGNSTRPNPSYNLRSLKSPKRRAPLLHANRSVEAIAVKSHRRLGPLAREHPGSGARLGAEADGDPVVDVEVRRAREGVRGVCTARPAVAERSVGAPHLQSTWGGRGTVGCWAWYPLPHKRTRRNAARSCVGEGSGHACWWVTRLYPKKR